MLAEVFTEHLEAIKSLNRLDFSLFELKKMFIEGRLNSLIMDYIQTKRSDMILGSFNCTYHPDLDLEIGNIKEVYPSLERIALENIVRCCILANSTTGLKDEKVVAIFPENLKNYHVREGDYVYYFADKFVLRHIKYTRKFLQQSTYLDFFKDIFSLNEKRLLGIVANWVHLHEASHREGYLPIPHFLKLKTNVYLAALEELRADINVILKSLAIGTNEAFLTAKYVFAERLIGYHLFREEKNFDTISSVIFWILLENKKFFREVSLKNLNYALKNILTDIEQIEKKTLTSQDMKECLLGYIRSIIGRNYEEKYKEFYLNWRTV